MIPCWTEFIRAITADEVDDWFELLIAFFLPLIDDLIRSLENIVACFDSTSFKACLNRFPIDIAVPGRCRFNIGDSGFEFLLPDGGIHECFNLVGFCIDDPVEIPLLAPLGETGLDILDFFFRDFWRLTVDLATCNLIALADCVANPPFCFPVFIQSPFNQLNDEMCKLQCIEIRVPIFSGFAGLIRDMIFVIVGSIDEIVGFFTSAVLDTIAELIIFFQCLGRCAGDNLTEIIECFIGGEGCDKRKKKDLTEDGISKREYTPEEFEIWRNFLTENGVNSFSTCGYVLHSAIPGTINRTRWGDYMTYWGCLGMYAGALRLKQRNSECQDEVDVGGLLDFPTFISCIKPAVQCISSHSGNSTEQEFKRSVEQFSATYKRSVSVVSDYQAGVENGTVTWNLLDDFFAPAWYAFTNSTYYSISADFGKAWVERRAYYATLISGLEKNNSSVLIYGDMMNIKKEEEETLLALYMEYANTILFYHRTQTPYQKRSSPADSHSLMIQYNPETRVVSYSGQNGKEYRTLTPNDLIKKREVATKIFTFTKKTIETTQNHSQVIQDIWDILNARYNFEYWPSVQRYYALVNLSRTRDFGEFFRWLKGDRQYLLSHGYVDNEVYASEMQKRDVVNRGSALDVASGNYKISEHRVYRPFPIPADRNFTGLPSWTSKAASYLMEKRREYDQIRKKRAENGFPTVIRSTIHNSRDWNQILYDFIDWFIELFFAVVRPLNNLVNTVVDFFATVDFEVFVLEDVSDFFVDYFTCSFPENVNGTELYSPWCIGFLPGGLYSIFNFIPNDSFPLQIVWPFELIKSNCTNTFNGNSDLFEFRLSDGCLSNDTESRPFCPECDYCPREYRVCLMATCVFPNGTRTDVDELCDILGGVQDGDGHCILNGDFLEVKDQCDVLGGEFQGGVGDILDTVLYMIGIFPKLFDDFFTGGIDIRAVEDLYSPLVGLLLTPFLLILYFGFGIYVMTVGLAHIPTWTIGKVFNDQLPFGFIIVIITVITLFLLPQLGNYFAVPFAVLTFASSVWFFSLFFTFGNIADTFNIIQFFIDIFKALDNNIFLFFIDFEPTLTRLQQFNYGSGPVPPLHTFCWFWNFSNLGFFVVGGFFSFFAARVLLFWIVATVIFLVDLLLALLIIRRKLIIWRLRVNVADIDETVEEFKENFKEIDEKFKDLEKKIKELEGLEEELEELEEELEDIRPASSFRLLSNDNNLDVDLTPSGPIKKRKQKTTRDKRSDDLPKEKQKKKGVTRKLEKKNV